MTDDNIINMIRNSIDTQNRKGIKLEEIEATLKKGYAKSYHLIIEDQINEIRQDMEDIISYNGQCAIHDPENIRWYSKNT